MFKYTSPNIGQKIFTENTTTEVQKGMVHYFHKTRIKEVQFTSLARMPGTN